MKEFILTIPKGSIDVSNPYQEMCNAVGIPKERLQSDEGTGCFEVVDKDFYCKCGFGCNTIDALSWHIGECKLRKK